MTTLAVFTKNQFKPAYEAARLAADRSNVAEWKLPVEQRHCPSWEEIVA